MAVEDLVDPPLNAALEGVEDGGRDQDGDDQAPLAHGLGHAVVDHDGDERDDAEVASEDEAGGEGVGHAALEDEVSVHEPVADDGPTEGERQEDQRQAGQVGEQAGRVEVKQEGDSVKEGEGQNGEQCSTCNPLQLLAEEGGICLPVAAQEKQRGQNVKDCIVSSCCLVKAMLEEACREPCLDGPDPDAEQGRRQERRPAATASGGGGS